MNNVERTWQPMETAPKDGTRVLLIIPYLDGTTEVEFGQWEDERYAKKPKPYWRWSFLHGVTIQRQCQPTYWMPLPTPPIAP